MTKEAYLALAAAQYDALRAIGQEPDFYTLEEKFDQLWTTLGRSVL
ncbi:MAG: ISLre2 family transposase, partial [Cytophagaceae bacterium]